MIKCWKKVGPFTCTVGKSEDVKNLIVGIERATYFDPPKTRIGLGLWWWFASIDFQRKGHNKNDHKSSNQNT